MYMNKGKIKTKQNKLNKLNLFTYVVHDPVFPFIVPISVWNGKISNE